MGCSSCGSGSKPGGCKSNGGCSTGGCNRLNVYDWLVNLPFADPTSNCNIIEVSFNNGSRKDFYRNLTVNHFEKGDMVTVEGVNGFDVGMVSLSGELVRLQLKKNKQNELDPEIKKVLRRSGEQDLAKYNETKARERDVLIRSRAIARTLNLDMKLSEVEIQADGRKATFFYIADDRVDFRELIKLYAGEFKVKVEMRQIGARQEAAKVGGIGSCGRELCCSTWLTEFKSVTTTIARYQNLSINQTKLSGQCGRLKCCLNFELDSYLDALQFFPEHADTLEIERGVAHLVKKDIFKNLMWYTISGSTKHYPLTIARVKEIKELNKKGIRPGDLEAVEVTSQKAKEVEPEFVDVVGQISLSSLDRRSKKINQQKRNQQQQQQQQRTGARPQPNNRNRPNPNQAARPAQSNRPQQEQRDNNRPPQGGNNRPPQQRPGNNDNRRPPNRPNNNDGGGNNAGGGFRR
jgi:cell fate regulator YaaT (PSP1 superfamily)